MSKKNYTPIDGFVFDEETGFYVLPDSWEETISTENVVESTDIPAGEQPLLSCTDSLSMYKWINNYFNNDPTHLEVMRIIRSADTDLN